MAESGKDYEEYELLGQDPCDGMGSTRTCVPMPAASDRKGRLGSGNDTDRGHQVFVERNLGLRVRQVLKIVKLRSPPKGVDPEFWRTSIRFRPPAAERAVMHGLERGVSPTL